MSNNDQGNSCNDAGSVTRWLSEVRLHRSVAAENLWRRYSERLMRLAEKYISEQAEHASVVTEQGLTNDSLGAIFLRIRGSADPKGYWKSLAAFTITAAGNHLRNDGSSPPESAADRTTLFAEAISQFLAVLHDEELREVALNLLESRENSEIAAKLERSTATVERRGKLIRRIVAATADRRGQNRGPADEDEDHEPPGAVVDPSPPPRNPGGGLANSVDERQSNSKSE